MDDQLMDRIFLINIKKIVPVLLIVGADSGLYGNFHIQTGKDFIQKSIQLPGLCQKSGALSLGSNRPGGAAKIQVHFLISVILLQKLRCPYKVLCITGENLGHHVHSLISLRGYLADFLKA